jgi:hypothetical protein
MSTQNYPYMQNYPYIMRLEDGRRFVVVRMPSEDGPDCLVAYELGPIDWAATAALNPHIVGRMAGTVGELVEKFLKTLPKSENKP